METPLPRFVNILNVSNGIFSVCLCVVDEIEMLTREPYQAQIEYFDKNDIVEQVVSHEIKIGIVHP